MSKYNSEIVAYEVVYNISLGVLGSSLVVFITTIEEYRIEKRKMLERIWNECRKLNLQLYKIKPIYYKMDNELIINYINEIENNKNNPVLKTKDDENKYYKRVYSFFLKEYSNKTFFKRFSHDEKKKYIDSEIEHFFKIIVNDFNKACETYNDIYKYSFDEFNNLLGDVQFFTGKKEYNKIYTKLYIPLYDIYDKLKFNVCRHIQIYQNGESNNLAALLSIVLENQDLLFEKEESEEISAFSIYNTFYYRMSVNIENFRAKIIYKQKPAEIKKYPIVLKYYQQ